MKNYRWTIVQLSIFLFPLFPALGGVGWVGVFLWTLFREWREILNNKINWLWLILFLWLGGISLVAYKPVESWLGFANIGLLILAFLVYKQIINQLLQLRVISNLLVFSSIFVSSLGLGQLYGNWSIPLSFLGWELVAKGNPVGRVSSVFMYANILALYLCIVLTLGLGLWVDWYQRYFKQGKRDWKAIIKGILLTFTCLLNGGALILTNSRNAWLIMAGVVLCFCLYLGWRKIVYGFTFFIGLILGSAYGNEPIKGILRRIIPSYFWLRLSDEMFSERNPAFVRVNQWKFTLHLIQERPLTGWGLRNFSVLYQNFSGEWLGHPHNFFLMMMAETGVPSALFLFGLVGWILFEAVGYGMSLKADKTLFFSFWVAFMSCVVFNCFDVSIFDIRLNTFGWLLLTTMAGVIEKNSNSSK